MRIAIIGSREYPDKDKVIRLLDYFVEQYDDFILVTGGARGVDTWAIDYCGDNNIDVEIIRPLNPNKKIDYLFRNVEIITKADLIAAFWDGKSSGTKFVIDYAVGRGNKELMVYETDMDNGGVDSVY